MEGASDLLSNSKISIFLLRASFLHFWTSSLVISSVDSLVSWDMLLAIRTVLKKQTKERETADKSANSGSIKGGISWPAEQQSLTDGQTTYKIFIKKLLALT
jgi:hypothetical protein